MVIGMDNNPSKVAVGSQVDPSNERMDGVIADFIFGTQQARKPPQPRPAQSLMAESLRLSSSASRRTASALSSSLAGLRELRGKVYRMISHSEPIPGFAAIRLQCYSATKRDNAFFVFRKPAGHGPTQSKPLRRPPARSPSPWREPAILAKRSRTPSRST